MATFYTTANVKTNECVGNLIFGVAGSAACPAAVPANTYSGDILFLEGPVPAGGGTVTNLEVTTNTAVTGTGTWITDVIDNTTGSILLSCTITAGTLGGVVCQNTGSASVTAGHYLEVRVTKGAGTPTPADKPLRIMPRN